MNAEVVQLDEANLPGHPEEWEWAAAAINRVLDAVQGKGRRAPLLWHYGGQSVQKGSWSKLIAYLHSLHVDHIVMENAHRPVGELAVFKDLRPEIGMGLGVIDVKRTEVERPDDVARAIEQAELAMGVGRIRYVHPDCGFGCSAGRSPTQDSLVGAGTGSIRGATQESGGHGLRGLMLGLART